MDWIVAMMPELWKMILKLWGFVVDVFNQYVALRVAAISLVLTIVVLLILWLLPPEDGPRLTLLGPTDQVVGHVGQSLSDPVEVLVQTESGAVPGAVVVFAPTSGHGTATPYVAATDSTGRASAVWTLGSRSGAQKLVARVLGGDSAWITVQAVPPREEPEPTMINITPDSAVLRFVGDIAPFRAEVLDQYGDPFPGSITWSNKRPCIFSAGSYGFAIARKTGVDSIVAAFDTLRSTAPVRVQIGVP